MACFYFQGCLLAFLLIVPISIPILFRQVKVFTFVGTFLPGPLSPRAVERQVMVTSGRSPCLNYASIAPMAANFRRITVVPLPRSVCYCGSRISNAALPVEKYNLCNVAEITFSRLFLCLPGQRGAVVRQPLLCVVCLFVWRSGQQVPPRRYSTGGYTGQLRRLASEQTGAGKSQLQQRRALSRSPLQIGGLGCFHSVFV